MLAGPGGSLGGSMKVRRFWAVTLLVSRVVGEGCTSLREIPPADYVEQVPRKPVRVVTLDSLKYELDSATISGDTLIGYRRKDVEGPVDEFFTVKVPLDQVRTISSRRIDWYRTGLIGGVVVGAVVVAGVTRHNSSSGGGGGTPCADPTDPACK